MVRSLDSLLVFLQDRSTRRPLARNYHLVAAVAAASRNDRNCLPFLFYSACAPYILLYKVEDQPGCSQLTLRTARPGTAAVVVVVTPAVVQISLVQDIVHLDQLLNGNKR